MDRSDRQDRRRQGKSDPLDAVSAARAALSGRARGAPKGRDGTVEAIRALMVAKRSARGERTQSINQARALVATGPDDLRARFAQHTHRSACRRAGVAAAPPRRRRRLCHPRRPARARPTRGVPRRPDRPPRRAHRPSRDRSAPGLLALYGVGPNTAALLLIAAGDHPERLRSRSRLGAPVRRRADPRLLGQDRPPHRLNPGGDRQANHALWRIVFTRMGSHPPTRVYVERRTKEGKSKAGDHPLPEALRRPRGLPPPPPARRLTPPSRGRPDPIFGCRIRAGLRTIRRPSPALIGLLAA